MSLEHLNPSLIKPINKAFMSDLLSELEESMMTNGWLGRPLLVIETSKGDYFAWTGSHRLAAAMSAGMENIPCYVVLESLISSEEIDAQSGHVMDYDRFNAVLKTGDENAISLMRIEMGQA
jgi:hypothetical protein